jgi:hypothetical protein
LGVTEHPERHAQGGERHVLRWLGSLVRIVVLAALIYTTLVAALRVIGEQALAKMSAYDLIVTVALGSFLAHLPSSRVSPEEAGVRPRYR